MNYIFTGGELVVLLRLLLAHICTDFLFQPTSWVEDKKRNKAASRSLYLHGLFTGVVAYLFVPGWGLKAAAAAIIIGAAHTVLDLGKITFDKKGSTGWFIADQVFHILTILFVWLGFIHGWSTADSGLGELAGNSRVLIITTAYLLCLHPAAFLIQVLLRNMGKRSNASGTPPLQPGPGDEAGFTTGIFERVIVLTFILLGQFVAAALLIAGKLLFLRGDKERGLREAALTGTMVSFTIAILAGALAHWLISGM